MKHYIAALIVSTIIVAVGFSCWDIVINNSTYLTTFFTKKRCDYKLPEGWRVAYNADSRCYAIFNNKGEYLWQAKYLIETSSYTKIPPTTFYDSCTAKRFAEKYFIQEGESTTKGFK